MNAPFEIEIFPLETNPRDPIPFAGDISAGFPSPTEDYLEQALDLNQELIKKPASTFCGRVRGNSMMNAGIYDGDILIIDKSLEPAYGKKCVAFIDGDFTLKTLRVSGGMVWLMPENPAYKPIQVTEENRFCVWGIVTYIIHKT